MVLIHVLFLHARQLHSVNKLITREIIRPVINVFLENLFEVMRCGPVMK